MEIRAPRSSEQSAIEAVVAAAFEEDTDGRVVRMIRGLDETGATRISLIADDGEIVGHVQLSKAWIDTREKMVDALMLTPLSVAPRLQRHGIGSQLLAAALEAADRTGCVAVVLEGDPNYYGPRGFVRGASLDLIRPSLRIPEPAFQVASLASYEAWMTGHVIYPDVMWETDTVGLRDPLLARIEDALQP